MLPGNTSNTLVGNFLRAQQGVLETVRVSPDDLRLTVGEKVQALVTNQLNNGRFAVLVKDQLLDLNLPRNTQPGQQFELTVLSKEPQLTFQLTLKPEQAQQSIKDPNVALSKGATLIGELLQKADDTPASNLKETQPLFSGKPDSAQLANQLASRLAQSGLFYESHQAEWVSGERPLQSLLKEPQAAQTPQIAQGEATKKSIELPASNQTKTIDEVGKGQVRADNDKVGISSSERTESLKQGGDTPLTSRGMSVLDEKGLQQLVRQQLDLIENKPLVWQGQAWPGQSLRWELENERQTQHEGERDLQQWQTRLSLDLPTLGELDVVAQLQQGQFKLRFQVAKEETLQLLRQQQPELMRRFESAGLNLVASQVDGHEH
ncbi:flagellar hook-length control protein FliK [Chitinibacter sp. S2-10]|uniref:flagellar hook-length control protein FliK n=1 Tax=Chitinibacter sp. S2-10 TaxID=3373597 RepID=UPI003977D25D